MTGLKKIFGPLLCVAVLNSTPVAQPCLNIALNIQVLDRGLGESGSKKNHVMPRAYNPQRRGKPLPEGSWGGAHIRMEVTGGQTKIEYDCAHGTIPSRILLDSRGRFVVNGTHVQERGGPIRQGVEPISYKVRFKGSVKGKNMKLTVTRTDTRESIGTFTLTRGQESELVKCL